jgi:N-acetylmuramic acid 6-phosphate etherase
MARKRSSDSAIHSPFYLGIEGGGSHTVALLSDARGSVLLRAEFGPANILLLTDRRFLDRLREIRRAFAEQPAPDAICIALAGAHGEPEFRRIRTAARKVWRGTPLHATHDLESALACGDPLPPRRPADRARVLVLSGTGSCFLGKTSGGKSARFGGWGHVIGDKGSGYEIGLRALKACAFYYDRDGRWTRLGQRLLRALQLNHPEDLIPWSPKAHKSDIARLAIEVFAARRERDPIAKDILDGAVASLAKDAVCCARKLVAKGTPVEFVFAGSVLVRQPAFAKAVAREIRSRWPEAVTRGIRHESARGALVLAAEALQKANLEPSARLPQPPAAATAPLSTTEQRHPASENLDRMKLSEAIELFLHEDEGIPKALLAERRNIERVIGAITRAFQQGGRLFYVGAGTSGRLGILDASECPPTFRSDPEQVQGIIAGGAEAAFRSIEGAEDDLLAGAEALRFRGAGRRDVIVGIAASGRTPFVLGALDHARQIGAASTLVCFDPGMKRNRGLADIIIAPDLGPELLTGSTRLKSGTATKLILNLFTTLAMVRIGKVMSNLMVDLNPSNSKLRARALRIVQTLAMCSIEEAGTALKKSGWKVREAVSSLQKRKTPGLSTGG